MTKQKSIRVCLIYGGRSCEHEISIQSARSVIDNLRKDQFEVTPIYIDRDGCWNVEACEALPLKKEIKVIETQKNSLTTREIMVSCSEAIGQSFDVVFPMMHGYMGEDGTVQGLLELSGIPYVGCGVLSSALVMDKDLTKQVILQNGLKTVPYIPIKEQNWKCDPDQWIAKILNELTFPLFVKPANLGSSLGIQKVYDRKALQAAIEEVYSYAGKALIEQGIDAQEIEVSVLENADYGQPPLVSIPGEIEAHDEFYSYKAKYLDDQGASFYIPARITEEQKRQAQLIARQAFDVLECEGMARVDLFLDRKSGEILFNEANTIPGFTTISLYPKLWEASGISYPNLLKHLIALSLKRKERSDRRRLSYGKPNILET